MLFEAHSISLKSITVYFVCITFLDVVIVKVDIINTNNLLTQSVVYVAIFVNSVCGCTV